MTNQSAEPVRNAKSNTRQATVKLRQINVDTQQDYCHRDPDYLKDENLLPLAENIVAEGLQTPLLLKESGSNELGEMQFVLLGGHRRLGAIGLAIKRKLDAKRIHEDMEIPAIIVTPDDGQAETDFAKDVMVKSIGDNSNRRDLTEDERTRIVKKCRDLGIPDPRAASAMGLSESQYRRLAAVVETEWLLENVKQKNISMSHAANLRMACKTSQQLQLFRSGFEIWKARMEPMLEQERANARNIGRDLTGSANAIKKYLDAKLVKHWLKCIEENIDLDDASTFNFGVLVDASKGILTVPAITVNIREHRRNDLVKVINELRMGAQQSLRLLKQMELLQTANELSAEEESRLMQQLSNEYASAQVEKNANEKGRVPVEESGPSDADELDDLDLEDEVQEVGFDSATSDSEEVA